MAKPDNRADNVAHLQEHLENTEANLQEAEDYLDEHSSELTADEKQVIEAKNERRKKSMDSFAAEAADEAQQ
ncbi:small acid-soluble spore protein Tlp [Paenibacillus agricola]|uniref:Small acid-soluble spore protein Tlp n=1 Tax=Paenibacillus agricola TaxID=2716264 RepID=A0ABX0J5W0_9BACL|nr:small acid-soluble spore protein Tlp [Paenibacillus agricola]NHN31709.1 small acid-soluble spore protein Tlp [Paenibacillus agricola]